MKPIHIGLIGFANTHQKDWLEHFHRHPDIKVVAISDHSRFGTCGGEEHAKRLAVCRRGNAERAFSDPI